jgi:hypothetical protein
MNIQTSHFSLLLSNSPVIMDLFAALFLLLAARFLFPSKIKMSWKLYFGIFFGLMGFSLVIKALAIDISLGTQGVFKSVSIIT